MDMLCAGQEPCKERATQPGGASMHAPLAAEHVGQGRRTRKQET